MFARLLLSAGLTIAAVPAVSAETVTYGYDAKGRLTQVTHSGGPANGVSSTYAFDRADNRTAYTVVGASSNSPQAIRVVVVPLNGFTIVPLPAGQ